MDKPELWIVVLAGGEGRRLRPLVDQMYGDMRPKQFAAPIDGHGMLDQTLRPMRPLVPAERRTEGLEPWWPSAAPFGLDHVDGPGRDHVPQRVLAGRHRS